MDSSQNLQFNPFQYPAYVMAKPGSAACNLRCCYCYYLGKEKLQYIQAQPGQQALFTWHEGKPLLNGVNYREKASSKDTFVNVMRGPTSKTTSSFRNTSWKTSGSNPSRKGFCYPGNFLLAMINVFAWSISELSLLETLQRRMSKKRNVTVSGEKYPLIVCFFPYFIHCLPHLWYKNATSVGLYRFRISKNFAS